MLTRVIAVCRVNSGYTTAAPSSQAFSDQKVDTQPPDRGKQEPDTGTFCRLGSELSYDGQATVPATDCLDTRQPFPGVAIEQDHCIAYACTHYMYKVVCPTIFHRDVRVSR